MEQESHFIVFHSPLVHDEDFSFNNNNINKINSDHI